MNELVFYTHHVCPFAQRVWIALEELRLPYKERLVTIAAGKKEDWFTAVYQKALGANEGSDGKASGPARRCALRGRAGSSSRRTHCGLRTPSLAPVHVPPYLTSRARLEQVPVIADGDFVLTESLVVTEYLAQKFGHDAGVDLLPGSAEDKAFHTIFVEQLLSKFVTNFYAVMMEADAGEREAKHRRFLEAAARVSQAYAKRGGPFLMGERMTLADIAIFPFLERLVVIEHYHGLSIPAESPFTELHRFREAMVAKPSVKRTLQSPDYFIKGYASYIHRGG
jgi:glutathione S-transferase